jgi:hypothetical protein
MYWSESSPCLFILKLNLGPILRPLPNMAEIQQSIPQPSRPASHQAQPDELVLVNRAKPDELTKSGAKPVGSEQYLSPKPNFGLTQSSKKGLSRFLQRPKSIAQGDYKFDARPIPRSEHGHDAQSTPKSENRFEAESIPQSGYQYAAVKHEKVTVRLLKLLSGSQGSPLQGTLKSFSIKSPGILRPSFDAISYAWVSKYAFIFHLRRNSMQECLRNGFSDHFSCFPSSFSKIQAKILGQFVLSAPALNVLLHRIAFLFIIQFNAIIQGLN